MMGWWEWRERGGEGTNEVAMSPKKAFSLAMRGRVLVNSVCALA